SGDNQATRFSNVVGSHQSSIGLFRTAESYSGKHGYSLRMDGIEPGVNDRARERAIVIHPADYVNPAWIATQGRIGRSQGCPAVRPEVARMVVDSLKGGQFRFSWYPDQDWLQSSAYLNCEPARGAGILAARPGEGRKRPIKAPRAGKPDETAWQVLSRSDSVQPPASSLQPPASRLRPALISARSGASPAALPPAWSAPP